MLWSVCCVHIWTTEPTTCTCKARTPVTLHAVIVISLLGPVAHACHSHECSLRFFVMPVHRTYTSIRGTHASVSLASGIGCSVIASFLFSSFCCSSVSVLFCVPHWMSSPATNGICGKSSESFTQTQHWFSASDIRPHGILAFSCCLPSSCALLLFSTRQRVSMDSI